VFAPVAEQSTRPTFAAGGYTLTADQFTGNVRDAVINAKGSCRLGNADGFLEAPEMKIVGEKQWKALASADAWGTVVVDYISDKEKQIRFVGSAQKAYWRRDPAADSSSDKGVLTLLGKAIAKQLEAGEVTAELTGEQILINLNTSAFEIRGGQGTQSELKLQKKKSKDGH